MEDAVDLTRVEYDSYPLLIIGHKWELNYVDLFSHILPTPVLKPHSQSSLEAFNIFFDLSHWGIK